MNLLRQVLYKHKILFLVAAVVVVDDFFSSFVGWKIGTANELEMEIDDYNNIVIVSVVAGVDVVYGWWRSGEDVAVMMLIVCW